MITILTCRGTGESVGAASNMLAALTAKLPTDKYVAGQDIPYPASVGPANAQGDPAGPSADQSIAAGLPLLDAAVTAAPGQVGLCGYSLGALLVSRYLETYRGNKIAWVAMVANPARATGESVDPNPFGYGIEGAHAQWDVNIPVWSAANPLDGITSCPALSPLRQLAAGLNGLTFATLGWTAELAARLIAGQWPSADYTPEQLEEAGKMMIGYLFGGQHTTAYVQGGYLDRLASRITAA